MIERVLISNENESSRSIPDDSDGGASRRVVRRIVERARQNREESTGDDEKDPSTIERPSKTIKDHQRQSEFYQRGPTIIGGEWLP